MAKQKTIQDIINEIRDFRNEELIENKDNRVFYTTIVPMEKGETGRQIYRILEEYSIGENKSLIRELFYEYIDGPQLIAISDPEKAEGINPPEGIELKTEEEIAEWNLLINDIEYGRKKALEKINEQAKGRGINTKNDISSEKSIVEKEVSIGKKVFKKINELNKQNKEQNIEQSSEENEDSKVPFNISEQDAKRIGIIGMNTISLNQEPGIHGISLKQELGLDKDEKYADVDQIEIIPSDKLSSLEISVPDTPFIAVARHKDGSIEAFPENICKIDKGENNQLVNFDGQEDEVNRERPDTILQFKNNVSLSIKRKDPYGRVEVSRAFTTPGNKDRIGIKLQDKYIGTKRNDREAREIADPYGQGKENPRNVSRESKQHSENKTTTRADNDGLLYTATELDEESVIFYDGREMNFHAMAISYGGCANKKEVTDLLELVNVKLKEKLTVNEAVNSAIKDKNEKIISQLEDPEKENKVREVMKNAKIYDPRKAIAVLEVNNWDVEEAQEQCENDYRNQIEGENS